MITFFRKIRNKMLTIGSINKYLLYATGEIALVVIGILIALQINNWNESRKDRIKEKTVLSDILKNLNRNNEIIYQSLDMLRDFDHSSEVVLSVIKNKSSFNDTLKTHLFHSTRSGGLLFPLSTEGYESFKNAGFDIIRSADLKDQILELFEVDYKRIKEKTQWTMDMTVQYDTYFHSIFTAEKRNEYIPIDYMEILNDQTYKGIILNIKENLRDWYREDVILALEKSEVLVNEIEVELSK